jgi:hypothetical protein
LKLLIPDHPMFRSHQSWSEYRNSVTLAHKTMKLLLS